MEDLLQVGVITQTHGIRGEVKVFPTTDDANRFRKLKETILDTGKEKITLEIEGVKFFKQYVILKFKGYDNINDIFPDQCHQQIGSVNHIPRQNNGLGLQKVA